MMRVILMAVVLLAACGGSETGATLNPGLSGTWSGTTTTTMSGLTPVTYSAYLVVSVSGQTATISSVCADGSGTLSATGAGDTASWQGSYVCPPIAFSDCASVSFTLNSGTVHLANSNTLTAQGSAMGSGCGVQRTTTFSFTGSK